MKNIPTLWLGMYEYCASSHIGSIDQISDLVDFDYFEALPGYFLDPFLMNFQAPISLQVFHFL
jgi:hypothetical protein